jgi:hypothetical protein
LVLFIPLGAFFTRGLWAGKPVEEKDLVGKYQYLDQVQSNQKKALQELLDA